MKTSCISSAEPSLIFCMSSAVGRRLKMLLLLLFSQFFGELDLHRFELHALVWRELHVGPHVDVVETLDLAPLQAVPALRRLLLGYGNR